MLWTPPFTLPCPADHFVLAAVRAVLRFDWVWHAATSIVQLRLFRISNVVDMEFADTASAPFLTPSLRSFRPPVIIWFELSSFTRLQINGHRIVRRLGMSAVTGRVILDTQLTVVDHYSQITEMPIISVISLERDFIGLALSLLDNLGNARRWRTSPR